MREIWGLRMNATANAATKRKRKLTALPLLVVLFVISYFLLTKLVIEQDKTIDSQRSLIHMLFKDNTYLSMLHNHAGVSSKKARGGSQLQAGIPASQNPASRSQSSPMSSLAQAPSGEVPSAQVPASKVGPTANAKNDRKTRKAEKSRRETPPVELTDPSDMRRVSFSI